jgi:hypothetical protein
MHRRNIAGPKHSVPQPDPSTLHGRPAAMRNIGKQRPGLSAAAGGAVFRPPTRSQCFARPVHRYVQRWKWAAWSGRRCEQYFIHQPDARTPPGCRKIRAILATGGVVCSPPCAGSVFRPPTKCSLPPARQHVIRSPSLLLERTATALRLRGSTYTVAGYP